MFELLFEFLARLDAAAFKLLKFFFRTLLAQKNRLGLRAVVIFCLNQTPEIRFYAAFITCAFFFYLPNFQRRRCKNEPVNPEKYCAADKIGEAGSYPRIREHSGNGREYRRTQLPADKIKNKPFHVNARPSWA